MAFSCIRCPLSIKYEFKSLKNRPQTECKFRAPTLLGVHLDVVEMLGGEAGGVGALQLAVRVLKLAVGTLQLAVRTFKLAVGFQFAVGTLKFAVVNLAVIPARLAGKICLCKI